MDQNETTLATKIYVATIFGAAAFGFYKIGRHAENLVRKGIARHKAKQN